MSRAVHISLVGSGTLGTGRRFALLVCFFVLTLAVAAMAVETDRASCEAAGGHWGRFGLLQREQCNLPTRDAGAVCQDSADCQSVCVASDATPSDTRTSGQCFGWTITLGTCLNYVRGGVAGGMICED